LLTFIYLAIGTLSKSSNISPCRNESRMFHCDFNEKIVATIASHLDKKQFSTFVEWAHPHVASGITPGYPRKEWADMSRKKIYTVSAGFKPIVSWFTAPNLNHWTTFPHINLVNKTLKKPARPIFIDREYCRRLMRKGQCKVK